MKKIKNFLYGPGGIILAAAALGLLAFFAIRVLSGNSAIDVMGTINERGTIRIGVRTDLEPFGYYDEDGNLAGFEVELAKELGKKIMADGGGVELIAVTPKTRGAYIDQERCDILVSCVSRNEANLDRYNMSESYYRDDIMFICNSNAEMDLSSEESIVGVISGSASKTALEAYIEDHKELKAQVINVASYPEALIELSANRVDFYCGERSVLNSLLADGYKLSGPVIGSMEYAITCRKREKDLFNEVEKAYTALKEEGTLDALYAKYGLTKP